jgi:hypothetical protein
MHAQLEESNRLIISYMTLRQAIGVLGVLLPLAVMLLGGGFEHIKDSISAYYYSSAQDIFVGTLAIVGAFLVAYKGYDRKDQIVTSLSGLCALGVAVFPCGDTPKPTSGIFKLDDALSRHIHVAFAVTLFLLLAYTSLFLFTKTRDKESMTPRKKLRNVFYRICGTIMVVALAAGGVFWLAPGLTQSVGFPPILVVEALCLGAFGISWLLKGEAILGDS